MFVIYSLVATKKNNAFTGKDELNLVIYQLLISIVTDNQNLFNI